MLIITSNADARDSGRFFLWYKGVVPSSRGRSMKTSYLRRQKYKKYAAQVQAANKRDEEKGKTDPDERRFTANYGAVVVIGLIENGHFHKRRE
jgi:hypothetical protein